MLGDHRRITSGRPDRLRLAVLDAGHYPFVPHLSHFLHLHSPRPYEVWTAMDNAFVASCDALIRLDGISKGADAELLLARHLGIPVYAGVVDWVDSL